MNESTFEELRASLDTLTPPASAQDRQTYWVVHRKLGLAKATNGSIEIFVVGPELRARTPIVKRHLEHALWRVEENGDQLEANRIVLPPADHFVSIAALIAVEMLRAGIRSDRPTQEIFIEVEPIIEISLRQGALSEEHILGLFGELLCLESMLDAIKERPELRLAVLDMWQGYGIGRRDFRIGSTSIEVKATQLQLSSHKISGLHQIEVDAKAVPPETELFMLSFGLTSQQGLGQTLPQIVDRLLYRLGDSDVAAKAKNTLQRRLLDDISKYGDGSGRGYDHLLMSAWYIYQECYQMTFTPRLYDLQDEDIRLLRRKDVELTNVSPDDIQYRLVLQALVNDTNPLPNWQRAIVRMVRMNFGMIE